MIRDLHPSSIVAVILTSTDFTNEKMKGSERVSKKRQLLYKEQEKEKHVMFETHCQVNWCLIVQRNLIRNPSS